MIKIHIDGNPIEVEEGSTILNAARANDISIPHLCFHPALKPSGACKLCGVEVKSPSGRQVVMLSCILKAKEGLEVLTESELVMAHREKAFNKLLALAPDSERIRDLAEQFNVTVTPKPNGCIRCRLCVRVCKEIVKANALKMVKTDFGSKVVFGEGACIGCGTCANLCPTKVIKVEDKGSVRTVSIKDEIISRLPLERCEACGNRYATSEFLAHVADTTDPHPHTKEIHHLCPGCAKLMSDRALTEGDHIRK
ncbi:MAG: 2Fe-2S iron-sulfur cluster-binding protein [Desulfobacterales bacterium]|nr:2Fe-2S iron-sulfur cluster-binding protein [Desulfobacterales bacterium]